MGHYRAEMRCERCTCRDGRCSSGRSVPRMVGWVVEAGEVMTVAEFLERHSSKGAIAGLTSLAYLMLKRAPFKTREDALEQLRQDLQQEHDAIDERVKALYLRKEELSARLAAWPKA